MMVSGQTHENFMANLNRLVDVFPSPAFTSAEAGTVRRAAGCGENANPGHVQPKFASGDPAFGSYKPHRSGCGCGQKAQQEAAAVVDVSTVKKLMGDFQRQRESMIAGIASGLSELQGKAPGRGCLPPVAICRQRFWSW